MSMRCFVLVDFQQLPICMHCGNTGFRYIKNVTLLSWYGKLEEFRYYQPCLYCDSRHGPWRIPRVVLGGGAGDSIDAATLSQPDASQHL